MLKSKEQLELAQKISDACQDYITLAKAQAKLKDKTKATNVGTIVDQTVFEINEDVKGL